MDSELGRQIGNGLNNLAASVLEQQRAAARDRQALLDRMDSHYDKLDSKIDMRFAEVEKRLVQVCDQGGEEHEEMRRRIALLERDKLRRQDLARFVSTLGNATNFMLNKGGTLLVIAWFFWQAVGPAIARLLPPPSAHAAFTGETHAN